MIHPQESRILACRRCGAANRVPLEKVFTGPGGLRCGSCKKALLLGDDGAFQLDPGTYQHPLDRDAMAAVQRLPGVHSLIKALVESTAERYFRLLYHANFVRVGKGQLPTLQRLFEDGAQRLGVRQLPDLFLMNDPRVNAFTYGVDKPYVVVTSGLVDLLADEEVGAVMAHELSHWQSNHVLYKTATQLFVYASTFLATAAFGLGSLVNLVALPVKLALLKWDRCSELTADRGMLVATRDPELCLRVLFKLSGGSLRMREELSLDCFLEQAQQSVQASEEATLDRLFSLHQTMFQTHPFPLWRARELWQFAQTDQYLELLRSG